MSVVNGADPAAAERAVSGECPPPRPGAGGVRSLEARWILPGRPPAAMTAWIGRFPAQTVTLEDAYLVDPHLPGLSVKVRQGRAFEVKAFLGSGGSVAVPGRAAGHLECWQKWSFPCDPSWLGEAGLAGWLPVSKTRRISRFSLAGGQVAARAGGPVPWPSCAVELAGFRTLGQDWWTLGFEATGPPAALRGQFDATAALVFGLALPSGIELGVTSCMSYSQWLRGGC